MVDKAGLYGGGLELTCILYEGTITVTAGTSVFVENGALGKLSFTLGTEIKEGDFVGIHVDAYNDYDDCQGLPVVQKADATTGWIGIVKSQPVWHKIPTSSGSHSTWANGSTGNLEYGWFRVATVVMPSVTMAFKANVESTTITSGSPVDYDVSENAFSDAGTDYDTGCFSFHNAESDAENALIGIGFVQTKGGSDADVYGHGTV